MGHIYINKLTFVAGE